MTLPLVTVVVTAYDQREYVEQAVASALAQDHSLMEVVLVDDGSRDGTAHVFADRDDIRLVRQENRGVCAARNAGVEAAQGELLVFLDGDDRLLPHAVTTGLSILRATGADFATGRCRLIDSGGQPLPTTVRAPVTGDLYEQLLRETWVAPPSVVIVRRGALVRAGSWDACLRSGGDDYDMYLRLARTSRGTDHDSVVCEYRVHPGNRSADYRRCLDDNLRVLDQQARHTRTDDRLEQARRAGRAHYHRTYGAKVVLADLMAAMGRRTGVAGAAWRAAGFTLREPAAVARLVAAQAGRRGAGRREGR